MEGSNDNNENRPNINPEEDTKIVIKFLIETRGKFKNISTVELSNRHEALDLFNQKSKEGKDTILYEVHRTSENGKVVKKVPVLNTSKHADRMRGLQEELTESNPAIKGTANASISTSSSSPSSTPDQKSKVTLASMKYKIIILAAVVAGFILLLFILDIIAGGGSGNMSGHFIAFEAEAMQNYLQTTSTTNYN